MLSNENSASRPRAWNAIWIWNKDAPSRNAWVLFRSEFDLADPAGAILHITADTRYRVWINGHLLGDGPPQSQPYHQFYDSRDLSEAAQPGTNCIAVLVHHQGVQDSARGGLLAEVADARGSVIAASGEAWRTMVGPWNSGSYFGSWNRIGPFQEHVDLSRMPAGWQVSDVDDSNWSKAHVIGGGRKVPLVMPWCRVIPRDIEFLRHEDIYAESLQCIEECIDLATRRAPGDASMSLSQVGRKLDWANVSEPQNLLLPDDETVMFCSDRHRDGVTDGRYDPCVTLDFGRNLTAYAEVEVVASAGAVLEIGYAERLIDGRFNNSIECPFSDRVTFADGEQTFRPLVWRAFRYLRVRVKNAESGLRVRAVRAVEVNYPLAQRGGFKGSDRLEGIFDICRTTLKLCSIESLMDTPYREQAQWLGDVAAVTVPALYACFGDTALAAKFLRQAAMNTRPTGLIANVSNVASQGWTHDIPDYSLWWVMCLWRHHMYTGDEQILHDCYPEMQRVMRTHLERIGEDGIVGPMFGWTFIDWAPVDRDGASAAFNAIFAGACDAAAQVAEVKGDHWAAEHYNAAAIGVRAAFADSFVDPESGLVVDAVNDGVRSTTLSEHSNMAAIAFGCVDDGCADAIIDRFFVKRNVDAVEAQPFFMVVVLEALRKRGCTDLALQLIDERWGERMLDRGRTSCTEEWYENGSWRDGDWSGFQRTHSHAWSACPAEFLIAGLGGIEVIEPGCNALKVAPHKAPFPYNVTYPTPHGPVDIKWDGRSVDVSDVEGVRIESNDKHKQGDA